MNWLRDPTDDSRDYYLRSGPFVLCKAWNGQAWIYMASRNGELLHSGTRDECEAACEAFVARQAA
jgi:hypothetical protein